MTRNDTHPDSPDLIAGPNAVLEALRVRPASVVRIFLAAGRGGDVVREIEETARAAGIRVERVTRERIGQLYQGRAHQGVLARVGPFEYASLDAILERATGDRAVILLLDGIEDPMNLGSLLRSADAFGAAGVIIPRERAAPVGPAAVKASAGAAARVKVTRVVNLARTMEDLKTRGFWIVGADHEAESRLFDVALPARLGLVVGGEGRGLRRLTREHCDLLAAVPTPGGPGSLNAAVAGALFLCEHLRQGWNTENTPTG